MGLECPVRRGALSVPRPPRVIGGTLARLPMTISRKDRRRIVVHGREYIWYVAPDEDDCFRSMLTVVSSDRRVFLRYHLVQSDDTRFAIVLGPEFRVPGCGGPWRRFRCPQFGSPDAITPKDVRSIIQWAHVSGELPVEVDWTGQPLAQPRAV